MPELCFTCHDGAEFKGFYTHSPVESMHELSRAPSV
jgi:hypothetical protein